jgi:phenylacetate-CoA ligase
MPSQDSTETYPVPPKTKPESVNHSLDSAAERRRWETLPRAELERQQLSSLNALLADILPTNRFYAEKFTAFRQPLTSLADRAQLPFTTKQELSAAPPTGMLAVNQTWPTDRYARYHQTSGTHGRPVAVLETRADWRWWMQVWQAIFDAADVRPGDRVLMAFSFGPFIGFWSAFDAAVERGCLLLPGGGLSTLARLEMARSNGADVIFCTPSYALRMAEVGASHGLSVASLGIRQLVLAGEPGGSIPSVRQRIANLWQAHVHDHAGATEVGPWGNGDRSGRGLSIIESDFIAEFLQPDSDQPAAPGELAELVLTCLGRRGCPCIRYRTQDLVRARIPAANEAGYVFLDGGILGRADDMLVIRGVNLFPSSIDAVVREFPEIAEYRATVTTHQAMDQVALEVEGTAATAHLIGETLRSRLGLKIDVFPVEANSLPRFEGKGKRWIDQRGK